MVLLHSTKQLSQVELTFRSCLRNSHIWEGVLSRDLLLRVERCLGIAQPGRDPRAAQGHVREVTSLVHVQLHSSITFCIYYRLI